MRICAITLLHLFFSTVSGKYVVLSGQHRVEAARLVAAEELRNARPVPPWTQIIRCKVAKSTTTLDQRELIAGRSQARDGTVLEMPMSERLKWLLRELQKQQKQHDAETMNPDNVWVPAKSEALKNTYNKTGCKDKTEGSLVCNTLRVHCVISGKRWNECGYAYYVMWWKYFSFLFLPLQAMWTKAMAPVVDWLLVCGSEVIDVVRGMETGNRKVTANQLRIVESLYDPDDLKELAVCMRSEDTKPTASRLRTEVSRITRNRHWVWLLLHPGLDENHIHTARRMFVSSSCCLSQCFTIHSA